VTECLLIAIKTALIYLQQLAEMLTG